MKLIIIVLLAVLSFNVSAQEYTPQVSRDSVAALKVRIEILKASVKLHELKLAEAEQEADIEKQELKVLELQGLEKSTADESTRMTAAVKDGREADTKKAEKMSKKAANTSRNLDNAMARLQKQKDKVEDTRAKIKAEESKLSNRSLVINFSEN